MRSWIFSLADFTGVEYFTAGSHLRPALLSVLVFLRDCDPKQKPRSKTTPGSRLNIAFDPQGKRSFEKSQGDDGT